MERYQEMEDYIKWYRKKRKERKTGQLSGFVQKLRSSFFEKIDVLIREQEGKQKEEKGELLKYVFLCRLMSSYYTESYDAILGISSEKLYLDEEKTCIFWKPDPVYDGVDWDMAEVEKLLRQKYIHVQASELFYIKRRLLEDDWELIQESFRILSGQVFSRIGDSALKIEKEILFLCGNYMEHLQIVGSWEKKGILQRE